MDGVRARAEEVVAAVVAEAKEVAEAAANAEAQSKFKETNSDSGESFEEPIKIDYAQKEEMDTEMVSIDEPKGKTYSMSEASSEEKSNTYSPSSSEDEEKSKPFESITGVSKALCTSSNKIPTSNPCAKEKDSQKIINCTRVCRQIKWL